MIAMKLYALTTLWMSLLPTLEAFQTLNVRPRFGIVLKVAGRADYSKPDVDPYGSLEDKLLNSDAATKQTNKSSTEKRIATPKQVSPAKSSPSEKPASKAKALSKGVPVRNIAQPAAEKRAKRKTNLPDDHTPVKQRLATPNDSKRSMSTKQSTKTAPLSSVTPYKYVSNLAPPPVGATESSTGVGGIAAGVAAAGVGLAAFRSTLESSKGERTELQETTIKKAVNTPATVQKRKAGPRSATRAVTPTNNDENPWSLSVIIAGLIVGTFVAFEPAPNQGGTTSSVSSSKPNLIMSKKDSTPQSSLPNTKKEPLVEEPKAPEDVKEPSLATVMLDPVSLQAADPSHAPSQALDSESDPSKILEPASSTVALTAKNEVVEGAPARSNVIGYALVGGIAVGGGITVLKGDADKMPGNSTQDERSVATKALDSTMSTTKKVSNSSKGVSSKDAIEKASTGNDDDDGANNTDEKANAGNNDDTTSTIDADARSDTGEATFEEKVSDDGSSSRSKEGSDNPSEKPADKKKDTNKEETGTEDDT